MFDLAEPYNLNDTQGIQVYMWEQIPSAFFIVVKTLQIDA